MSVQSEINRVSYHGNASNLNPYGVPFYFLDENDLVVVVTDQEGEDETLVRNTDYSVSGAGNQEGGGIVTGVAIPATSTVTIYREVAPVQNTSYEEADAFPAKSHERALDRLTMLCQQVIRAAKRSYRIRESDGDINEIAAVANTILGINASKQPRTFTASELASFLNLTQQFFDRPTKTFADAGERALAVPEFTGQIGTQRDNGSIWVSDGVGAGDWEYFDNAPDAGSVVTSMLASGVLSADGDGRAKMADGYVTLTKIASGIFTADSIGRGKFAGGFVNQSLCAADLWREIAPVGAVLQTVSTVFSAFDTITAAFPCDNSVPQSTEGEEVLTATITPSSASNKVRCRLLFFGTTGIGSGNFGMGVFRDSVGPALEAVASFGAGYAHQLVIDYIDAPASISAVTYKMRAGSNSGTLYCNGDQSGVRLFNGVGRCSIILQEIKG